jgi:hypothetical protein
MNSVEFSRVQWLYVGGTATSAPSHYGMMKIKNYWPPLPLSTQPVCPLLHPASVSSLRNKGEGVHTRRAVRGWGVNISEDARHWIGLLQYNPSTDQENIREKLGLVWRTRRKISQIIIDHLYSSFFHLIILWFYLSDGMGRKTHSLPQIVYWALQNNKCLAIHLKGTV